MTHLQFLQTLLGALVVEDVDTLICHFNKCSFAPLGMQIMRCS